LADTIPARLFAQAETRPGSPAYYEKVEGEYRSTSWSEYAAQVRRAGKALLAMGLRPGGVTTILGFNRPEWVIFDLATMAVGGAPAGIYATSSPEEVEYVCAHGGAPVILVENKVQLDKVLAVRHKLPDLRWIVTMRSAPKVEDPQVLSWEEFLAMGVGTADAEFDARVAALEPNGLATLIYTSGTTGPPKGVMLSHSNLTWTADMAPGVIPLFASDTSVSYLPLSHIAEQMFSVHIPITNGYPVYYAESIDALLDNLKEVRPTIFFGVPRVWEKFHAGIALELGHASGARARLAAWAQKVGREAVGFTNRGKTPPRRLRAKLALAGVVHAKVTKAIGLARVRAAVSGAAPISAELLEFFAGFNLSILEVYGQSEGSGPTTFNRPGNTKFGSVGLPYPGTEVRLGTDGEVMVRGGNVFAGYYRNPQATAETIDDGWLLSGDLGSFDSDGFLFITGRKKDIIITAGGKNIAPKDIEAGLKDDPLVSEAVLIGDRRKYLTALVTLDPEATAAFADHHALVGPPHESPEIRRQIQSTVDGVNKRVGQVAQVKKFVILPRELSIEAGELTGTLKVKRNRVTEHFAAEIESLYAED